MRLNYTKEWTEVENTVNDRLLDDSLLHTLNADKKIKKRTKFINKKLKKFRNNVRDYKQFIGFKKQVIKTCDSNDETDDEPGLSYEACKKIHSVKSKFAMRTFLRTCILTKRKSPTVKCPHLSNANRPKRQFKSTEDTSISNSKILQSKSKLSNTESRPYQTRFSKRKKIIPATLEGENVNGTDVDSEDNANEIKCNKKITDYLTSSNAQNKAVDKSLESDSVNAELAASELNHNVTNSSKDCFKLKNVSIVSIDQNQNQDNFIEIADITDVSNSSSLYCRDTSNRYNLHSQEDIFMTNDERLGSEENLGNLNNNEKYIDALHFDSGNNSYSDTNISRDEYTKNFADKAPVAFDYHDKGVFAEQCLSINEDASIPRDNNFEFVNNVIEINDSVDIVGLVNDFDITQPEFRCESSADDVILSDSYLGGEASQEIGLTEPLCFSQLKGTFSTVSTTDDTRSRLETKTIEEHDEGNEIFSKYQSHKRKKVQIVNNSCNKSMENEFPSEDEQPLRPRKSSGDFDLPQSELQDLNQIIVHEDSVENKPIENEFLLEDEQPLISRKFSEDCTLSQSGSQDSDPLIVHKDYVENKSTENELTPRDEQPLIARKFSADFNLSQSELQNSDQIIVSEDSIENERIENAFPLEDDQPLISRKFSEDCTLSPSESQHLNGSIDHAEFLSSSRSNGENLDNSMSSGISLEDKVQSEGNKFFGECNISAIQSHQWNRSLNSSFSSFSARSCDENFKNSLKTQLLSEIEQRLKDCPTSQNRSSCTQEQTLNGSLDDERENSSLCFNLNGEDSDDQLINNELHIEDDAESLQSNRLKIRSQNLSRFSNIEDSSLSLNSTPAKRRISNSEKDHCSLKNPPSSRKLPRLDKHSANRQLKLITYERKSQEAISHEMQPRKNKDDSLVENLEELNTCKDNQSKQKKIPRPQNLEDFVATEALTQDILKGHFRPKDIGEDDEIWIMEIPKTIHPKDLENEMILLGGKSELKFGNDCYKVSSKPTKRICNISCIFTTSRRKKEYKIVNVESKGKIKFRRKLSVIPETELIPSKVSAVPFPKNLKIRHPLFGAAYKDKI